MDRGYKSISASDSGDGVGNVSGPSVTIDGEWRGVKRKRSWMNAEPGDVPVAGACINEKKVGGELILPALDMRRTKESEIPATSRGNADALNSMETIREIMDNVVKEAIIPYYAEYLGERGNAALCFYLADARFLYSADAPRADGADVPDVLQQVRKIHKANTYMHIKRRITDSIADTALVRMKPPADRTFYRNKRPLERTMSAMPLCFLWHNAGRSSWSIGTCGVGDSLFTSLINNDFNTKR